jgi:Na+-driven multidrug efflux pump
MKHGVTGAGLATVCSEATTLTVLTILFLLKKFDTRTRVANMCELPMANAWTAVKTGLTQFIIHLSYGLPFLLTRKYIREEAETMGCYTECIAAFNSVCRIWSFAHTYATAIALLPTASFAVGAKWPGRVLALFGWASRFAFIWCAFTEVILLALGNDIAQIFGNEPGLIDASVRILTAAYAAQAVCDQGQVMIVLLQAVGHLWIAMALSIVTQAAAIPLFGCILFFTDPAHDVFRLMWMYSIADAFGLVVCLGLSIWPLKVLWRGVRDENAQEIELQRLAAAPEEGSH